MVLLSVLLAYTGNRVGYVDDVVVDVDVACDC